MLTGESRNGFTIADESSNPPFGSEAPMLPIISVAAENNGQRHVFHFHTGPKILPHILQVKALAEATNNTVPHQQAIIESYVLKAFEQVTANLSEKQIEQAQGNDGYTVNFMEDLVSLPASGL